MKIVHYTLTVRENKAAGSTAGRERRRLDRAGPEPESGGGRVIDLEEWKAAHPDPAPLPEGPTDEAAAQRPASSRRGFLDCALQCAELLATLCVIAVLAALVLRVLVW